MLSQHNKFVSKLLEGIKIGDIIFVPFQFPFNLLNRIINRKNRFWAIYCENNEVVWGNDNFVKINKIENLPDAFLTCSVVRPKREINIIPCITYLKKNIHSKYAFHNGITHYLKGDDTFFQPPMLDYPTFQLYSNISEYENQWQRFRSQLQPGDIIFSYLEKDKISKIITFIDGGIWSHVATYIGNDKIYEITTSGSQINNIEDYHHHRYRLGLYRAKDIHLFNLNEVQSTIFKFAYFDTYIMQSKFGWIMLLVIALSRLSERITGRKLTRWPSVNNLLYELNLYLVDYI